MNRGKHPLFYHRGVSIASACSKAVAKVGKEWRFDVKAAAKAHDPKVEWAMRTGDLSMDELRSAGVDGESRGVLPGSGGLGWRPQQAVGHDDRGEGGEAVIFPGLPPPPGLKPLRESLLRYLPPFPLPLPPLKGWSPLGAPLGAAH